MSATGRSSGSHGLRVWPVQPVISWIRRLDARVLTGLLIGVLLVVSLATATALLEKSRHDTAVAQRQARGYTAPPLATPSEGVEARVTIIGDGSVNQAARNVKARDRWPARLAKALKVRTTLLADPGSGYVSAGSAGRTFVDQASRVPPDTSVIVFVGGASDASASTLHLVRSASDAITAGKNAAPNAKIILIGPVLTGVASESTIERIGGVLENAAGIGGAAWVDPYGQEWLDGRLIPAATLLSSSDEKSLAGHIETLVDTALPGS